MFVVPVIAFLVTGSIEKTLLIGVFGDLCIVFIYGMYTLVED